MTNTSPNPDRHVASMRKLPNRASQDGFFLGHYLEGVCRDKDWTMEHLASFLECSDTDESLKRLKLCRMITKLEDVEAYAGALAQFAGCSKYKLRMLLSERQIGLADSPESQSPSR